MFSDPGKTFPWERCPGSCLCDPCSRPSRTGKGGSGSHGKHTDCLYQSDGAVRAPVFSSWRRTAHSFSNRSPILSIPATRPLFFNVVRIATLFEGSLGPGDGLRLVSINERHLWYGSFDHNVDFLEKNGRSPRARAANCSFTLSGTVRDCDLPRQQPAFD